MDRQPIPDDTDRDACNVDGDSQVRERALAALARRQNGVARRDQLLNVGLSRYAIDSRVKSGRLQVLHRGVYLLGPVAPPLARETAAVLACGHGAVLSHGSAAALWQLIPFRDRAIDVTVPARRTRRRRGIRTHRVRTFEPDEITVLNRIPVTTPARTVLDMAAKVPTRELEQAVAEAERKRHVSRPKLLALLARYPRRPGTAALRSLLRCSERPALTRSGAEVLFLSLVRRAQLSQPEVNTSLHGHEVDFLWRRERLIVETDGFAFHRSRREFEADRRRDTELAAQGFQVMRVTWRQITGEPEATLTRVAQALARRSERSQTASRSG